MVKILVQVSKYVLLLIMIFFTVETFMVLKRKSDEARRRIMRNQIWLMILFNTVSYVIMYLQSEEPYMILMLICVIGYSSPYNSFRRERSVSPAVPIVRI